jgi:hypothetical protein
MIVEALTSGTKPGLQAVWHIFFLGLSRFALLEADFSWASAFG